MRHPATVRARMGLFQDPPKNDEDLARSRPLDIPPSEVLNFDEKEWYEKAFRGEKVPQLTVRAVVMGSVLGFFLSFTNLYVGLKTGWFLGVAITACILSFTIWSGLLKLGFAKTPMTILETNCMQSTASSAGYATGNSLVTAFPAMLMLSVSTEAPGGTQIAWPLIAAWVFFLAILGVSLAIPMKRNMINHEKLTFPSGTAAAVTLHSLYSEASGAIARGRALMIAAIVGALGPILFQLEILKKMVGGKLVRSSLLPDSSKIFDWLPHLHAHGRDYPLSQATIRLDHSAVLVGAGAIVGVRTCASMVLGGLFVAFWLGPHAMDWEWVNPAGQLVAAASKPEAAWKEIGIWLGAPMMVSAGLLAFALQWRTIVRAFTSMASDTKKDSAEAAADAEGATETTEAIIARTEAPAKWLFWGVGFSGTAVSILAWKFFEVPFYYGILAVLLTFVLALVAARATGETDITPGGPLGKIMQLTYGVLIPQSTSANLMTASITSNASLACADLLNDLKSGYLLGAHPRRQFIAQLMGVFTGTIASTLGYFILVPNVHVFDSVDGADPKFAAPGAQQWKAVAELFKVGIQNLHPMARECIVAGVLIGAAFTLFEHVVPKAKRRWLPSATGIGLGLLLPFSVPLSFFIGAMIGWALESKKPKLAERFIVPIASGIIAGESIIGVIVTAINNFVFS
ncbi:MAG: OPT family oligopeptide transporter [Polyangiaceae bacterium]